MKKLDFLRTSMMLALMFASLLVYSQPELLVHYKFDETSGFHVSDNSGNSFDGLTDCETCWVAEGEIGGAIHFSGVERLDMPATDIGLTTDEGSVAFWVLLPEASAAEINCIWWAGEKTGGDGMGPNNEMHVHTEGGPNDYWAGGEVSFNIVDSVAGKSYFLFSDPEKGGNAATTPVNPILLTDSTWHHVACTYEPGKMALYIDGEPIWDTTQYLGAVWDCNYMTIGVFNQRTSRTLVGSLDDFRLYSGALEAEDVSNLYNKINTSVDPLQANAIDLSIFPNPATSEATLSFSIEAGRNVSVNLYSVTGSIIGNVYEGISVAGKNVVQINTSTFSPGIYFVELQINNDVTYTKLLVQ